jgi:hypothetical protein
VAAVEDILEGAHAAREDSRRSVKAFVGGVILLLGLGLNAVGGGLEGM